MAGDDSALTRLGELMRRYDLEAGQREPFAHALQAIARDRRGPTSIRAQREIVDKHFADSLVALELEVARSATTIADVGAGAGFPGLALAIALPGSDLRLVESQRDKCIFLGDLLAEVGVDNARVICARAEEWEQGVGQHDLVTARALAPQPVLLEYAAPLLRSGGALVDWRGQRDAGEEESAARAAEELGLRLVEIRRVEPFAAARNRHLHVFVKARETPARFPRRAGMARKRPLGV